MAHTEESIASMDLPKFMDLARATLGEDKVFEILQENDLARRPVEQALWEELQRQAPNPDQQSLGL